MAIVALKVKSEEKDWFKKLNNDLWKWMTKFVFHSVQIFSFMEIWTLGLRNSLAHPNVNIVCIYKSIEKLTPQI